MTTEKRGGRTCCLSLVPVAEVGGSGRREAGDGMPEDMETGEGQMATDGWDSGERSSLSDDGRRKRVLRCRTERERLESVLLARNGVMAIGQENAGEKKVAGGECQTTIQRQKPGQRRGNARKSEKMERPRRRAGILYNPHAASGNSSYVPETRDKKNIYKKKHSREIQDRRPFTLTSFITSVPV